MVATKSALASGGEIDGRWKGGTYEKGESLVSLVPRLVMGGRNDDGAAGGKWRRRRWQ